MAITQWSKDNLPVRGGLYTNFVNSAIAQITGGTRGIVAIPLVAFSGTAEEKKLYTVENETEATELFGAENIQSIKFALQAGARQVLAYTMPESPIETDYEEMRNTFEAYPFNVFVFDGNPVTTEITNTVAWVTRNRQERKHFYFVLGGTVQDDTNVGTGNTRTTASQDDYIVNLVNGVVINGVTYSSGQYASYIAGLVASTPINQSITFLQLPVDDVTKRYRNSEIVTSITAGSLVLSNDGDGVKIESGITTGKSKIRSISSRQQVATDIERTARNNYIGKLDNNEDGQMALINAINAYLETLENSSVLSIPEDGGASLDAQNPSTGDSVFLKVAYDEVDSMERVFLTIVI